MKQLLLIVVASALLGTGCERKFADDIELIAPNVTFKKMAEVTQRTGIQFPVGATGLGYVFFGWGLMMRWLQDQRNSRHGVDFAYNLPDFDLNAYYTRYCETLLAIDENLGRLFDLLEKKGLLESTLVVYMGDNGFQFGEQGLIDKRTAYEASMRIPFLMHCPELIQAGSVIKKVVANIDVGPTLLEITGLSTPKQMSGRSFWQLAKGNDIPWRDYVLYEYFWERNYPHTPTTHAVRGERFKYIRYHGLWDTDELYDLLNDPDETTNLIFEPDYKETVAMLNKRLFALLAESGGASLRFAPDRGPTFPKRHPQRSEASDFPKQFYGTRE